MCELLFERCRWCRVASTVREIGQRARCRVRGDGHAPRGWLPSWTPARLSRAAWTCRPRALRFGPGCGQAQTKCNSLGREGRGVTRSDRSGGRSWARRTAPSRLADAAGGALEESAPWERQEGRLVTKSAALFPIRGASREARPASAPQKCSPHVPQMFPMRPTRVTRTCRRRRIRSPKSPNASERVASNTQMEQRCPRSSRSPRGGS